ncbi:putative DNA-binding transcriptional regulator AlpA [Marinobacterium sp. MBR-111]|jgi:predicted DNA-binding transcriptional regulator AlpA|uniref:helix-turn-helix transcriptional regulator n=1 Tax=Marinobacterium sp. MBR-111 TaxID=3156463 RepID=UPI003399E2CA
MRQDASDYICWHQIFGKFMAVFDFGSDDVLLDIDSICKKLCISRSSLERLRRQAPKTLINISVQNDDNFMGLPSFPEPTLMLGRSPRWSTKALNSWIEKAQSSRTKFI